MLHKIYVTSTICEILQTQYMCILFRVWSMCLMPEDGQYWPKHVACVDKINTVCCGWWYRFIQISYHYEVLKHNSLDIHPIA